MYLLVKFCIIILLEVGYRHNKILLGGMLSLKKKLIISVLTCGLALFSSIGSAFADYEYPLQPFTTYDGKWDGTVYATTDDANFRIWVTAVDWIERDLITRLCSATSGSCTSYKGFSDYTGFAEFYNMKPGKYYIDIAHPNLNGSVTSEVGVYRW